MIYNDEIDFNTAPKFMNNRDFTSIRLQGKFIYINFDRCSLSLWSTLGLTGNWRLASGRIPDRHARLLLTFNNCELFCVNDQLSESMLARIVCIYTYFFIMHKEYLSFQFYLWSQRPRRRCPWCQAIAISRYEKFWNLQSLL